MQKLIVAVKDRTVAAVHRGLSAARRGLAVAMCAAAALIGTVYQQSAPVVQTVVQTSVAAVQTATGTAIAVVSMSVTAVGGRVVAAAVAVAFVAVDALSVFAQTAGATFPDLAEPISITEVGTKVVAFLAVGLGVVVAIKIGLVLMRKLLGWFGKGV